MVVAYVSDDSIQILSEEKAILGILLPQRAYTN